MRLAMHTPETALQHRDPASLTPGAILQEEATLLKLVLLKDRCEK